MTPVSRSILAFAAFGGMFGTWQVLLPDLVRHLGISPPLLGLALSIGFVPSIPMSLLAGRLMARHGAGVVALASGSALAACLVGFSLVGSYLPFVVLACVFFAASGSFDVAINAMAIHLEQERRSRLLTWLHAAYSAGGFAGAVLAGVSLALGAPFMSLLLAAAALTLAVAIILRRARSTAADVPPGTARSALRDPVLLLLAATAAFALVGESAMESWSAIYLRNGLGLPVVVGALGVAIFHGMMALGRVLGGAGIARLERSTGLVVAGSLAAAGMLLAVATTDPVVVLVGFTIVAAGLSVTFPLVLSWAGARRPASGGSAAAAIISIAYSGFLVGPAVIGGLAQLASLRVALLTVSLCGLLIILGGVTAGRVSRARQVSARG
ncbi:MAG: MFS transporter [Chloroflexota bacterium]|nr:MFS transporter [Chloroflexota bacterium]